MATTGVTEKEREGRVAMQAEEIQQSKKTLLATIHNLHYEGKTHKTIGHTINRRRCALRKDMFVYIIHMYHHSLLLPSHANPLLT